MKKFSKRLLSALMVLMIAISAFPLTSYAAKYITNMNSDAVFGVISGSYDDYGHELHYAKYDGATYITFCCEYGVESPTGTTYKYGNDFKAYLNRNDGKYETIADYIAFGYTLVYGDGLPSTKAEKIAACCTQQYVWEKLGVNPTRSSWVSSYMSDDLYKDWKKDTEDRMAKYYDIHPSFDGTTKTMNLGASTTLTDSNGVFKYYPTFSKTINKVTFSHTKGENKLTISVADNCSTHSVTFKSASYDIFRGLPDGTPYDADAMNYVYFDFDKGTIQDLMFSHYVDPETFGISVNIEFGSLKIVKTSEDKIVDGITFNVSGNGINKNVTTKNGGEIQIDGLVPGTYTVTETADTRYVQPKSQTVKVENGKTASVSFTNTLKKGKLKVQKDSDDHIVKGFTFTVSSSTGKTYPITSDSNGVATLTDLPVYDSNNKKISYTVKETSVPIRYVTPDEKTITLEADSTSTVNITNTRKKGNLEIIKHSEDKIVKDFTFSVTGSDGSSYSATTNSNGIATLKDLPVYDSNNQKITYTVQETNIPVRYVTPDKQTVILEPDKTSSVTIDNILKKFRVKVIKEDIEKGKAQGDASLAGAVYGLYKGDKLVAEYTTDENASFITDYYVCDTDWTIKEIRSSEGYLVDSKTHTVGADPKLYTVEYNTTENKVQEQVVKGKISIIKHTGDGSTQIETPEKNAEFQIYLKSSGSYAKADKDERDTIVCDEDGFGSTKLLPYGTYTVHQTKGWDGRELIKDFDVYINQDGKDYKFLINNSEFCSYLKVVKLDKETNKPIAYAGAAFEIYDSNNHRVSMQFTYPKVTTIHTFYTNSEGYLITPEQLPYGEYTLKEVQAPYGYVLDDTPIPFSIKQENSSTDTGVTVVKVKAHDIAQKGTIDITKTGEIFASVNENENIFTPVYEIGNLSNAVFEIFAAEDITTLDGTVRYQQGEKVDEITTDSKGIAKSKQLYLGKYTVIEKTAPNSYVNSNEQYNVELTYAGHNVSVTSTALSVNNDRQKVMLSLKKSMEQNKTFGIGMNEEILSVQFGVFSNEDIKAADSSVIPADSLITFANCDTEGKITFNCDLPIGFKFYVKEITTDEHYVLSDTKYEFETTYAGQDISLYDININDNADIENDLIYGSVQGLKIDRETNTTIKGAVFGLFKSDETEYTEKNAILTATSDENGVFVFDNIPYGSYVVKELKPADNYLPNEEYHHIIVNADKQIIEITVVNDRIPEICTTATVDGQKECCATEVFTLVDTVEYKHLIPGKEYTIKGILMDKSTGKPFLENGKEIVSEVTFIPEAPSGTVEVLFTFDSKLIKAETNIVVFESLYKDNQELTVHADIDDEAQTVTVKIPNIKTSATVKGKKTVKVDKEITIKDTVSYENLTVGKEYTIKGILMNKATGKPFKVNGKEVTAEVTFIPDKSSGTVEVEFTFDGSAIKKTTDLVVFETLYRDEVEIASHADIKDKEQTVTIEVPVPKPPKTSDDSNIALWIALAGASAVGIVGTIISLKKRKKEDK